jgi:hypothetical protein
MKCDMDFKFDMGAAVRFRIGKYVCEGTVTARIEAGVHPHYRIQIGNGNEFQASEKHMWIVSCVPGWLHPGAMVQWVGEGPHEKYVVKELYRGGRYRTRSFAAERDLIRPDGTSFGRERSSTECTPANMAFWRPWQEKKPRGKDGYPEKVRRKKNS